MKKNTMLLYFVVLAGFGSALFAMEIVDPRQIIATPIQINIYNLSPEKVKALPREKMQELVNAQYAALVNAIEQLDAQAIKALVSPRLANYLPALPANADYQTPRPARLVTKLCRSINGGMIIINQDITNRVCASFRAILTATAPEHYNAEHVFTCTRSNCSKGLEWIFMHRPDLVNQPIGNHYGQTLPMAEAIYLRHHQAVAVFCRFPNLDLSAKSGTHAYTQSLLEIGMNSDHNIIKQHVLLKAAEQFGSIQNNQNNQ